MMVMIQELSYFMCSMVRCLLVFLVRYIAQRTLFSKWQVANITFTPLMTDGGVRDLTRTTSE